MTPESTSAPAVRFPPPGVVAAVFDVVGTLVAPAEPIAATYAAVGRRHGRHLDEQAVAASFREAWRRQECLDADTSPPFTTSRSRERDRWRLIVEDVFGEGDHTAMIFADLWEHYATPRAWKPLAAGTGLLEQACDAGLAVALASNFDERLLAIAPVVEPLTRFDRVFASSEIGWRKPAVQFFRRVEELLGLGPRELVLVGDDPELDVAAAVAAGWQSVLVA